MGDRHGRAALAWGAALVLFSSTVRAEPNVSVAATIGGGIGDLRSPGGASGLFHLGARADALFLRQRDADMAIGPYVDFATSSFSTAELGGGVEWLVPLSIEYPLMLSAGALARQRSGVGWEPGVESTLFIGSKSHNFHSIYGLGAGLFLQGRLGLVPSGQADIILGAHLDLALLALPFVLAFNALRP